MGELKINLKKCMAVVLFENHD